ncbi:hypothetical protein CEV31_3708 [Brucella thiophenivorans]|uniref:Uncharacterized protein n=1 Tax=Brucella thiophenivorans TaxID=571255 RepID=A0A256FA15_9HYPH|nr:hypothetical protein CEV31_3708 [Brucella thiophenivorans]
MLKKLDLAADRTLTDVELVGRGRKASRIRDNRKTLECLQWWKTIIVQL